MPDEEPEARRIALHAYRTECLAARVGGPRPGDFEAGWRAGVAFQRERDELLEAERTANEWQLVADPRLPPTVIALEANLEAQRERGQALRRAVPALLAALHIRKENPQLSRAIAELEANADRLARDAMNEAKTP